MTDLIGVQRSYQCNSRSVFNRRSDAWPSQQYTVSRVGSNDMIDDKKNTSISSEGVPTTPKQPVVNKDAETDVNSSVMSNEVVEQDLATRSQQNAKRETTTEMIPAETRSKKVEDDFEAEKDSETKPVRWVQIRLLPIYARVLIVLGLIVLAIIVGTYIGYSVLGDGAASDIFKKGTWTHIFDIISGKE